ncbi:MAG: hypothetical protein ACR2Q3_09385 [Woeseiaceae bacterium]
MELEPDITQEIEKEFNRSLRSSVQEALISLETVPEFQRVARCVLFLAGGDEGRLAHFVTAAHTDYRDVIWWAEYDGKEERLRDFARPFTVGN